jgi:serine phosphatase RsbU (regulator of sigma subunit)/Tfp pilus assembly protein PilF
MRQYLIIFLFAVVFSARAQYGDRVADSLSAVLKTTTDPRAIYDVNTALLFRIYVIGKPEEAKERLHKALADTKIRSFDKQYADLLHYAGNIMYYESRFDSALVYYNSSYQIRVRIKDNEAIVKSLNNIGGIHFMKTEYVRALRYYEEALAKEAELKVPEGSLVPINNIGSVYSVLKMHNKALHYFKVAAELYKNSPADLVSVYSSISDVYKTRLNEDSAFYYQRLALALAKKMNYNTALGYCYMGLGVLLEKRSAYDSAVYYLRKALEMAMATSDARLAAAIYGNLAVNAMQKGQMDTAMAYIEQYVDIQKQLNVKVNREDISRILGEYYYRKKDYKQAYEQLNLFTKLSDSLFTLETTAQIAEMQEKFETDKKEKENQLLTLENKTYRETRNYLIVIAILALLFTAVTIAGSRRIKKAGIEISEQKDIIEEKQKDIMDSIRYAQRIQHALLTGKNIFSNNFSEHFICFMPRDVVSGDFYWATGTSDGFIYVTADCTGHGVPGAFMSLLNISKLNHTINEKEITRPDLILNSVREEIISSLNPVGVIEQSNDGMDAVVCKISADKRKLEYASANNAFYIIRKGLIMTCRADKMPVGKSPSDQTPFTYNEVQLEDGDVIYTFTDGFADQFGGPLGKKFKYRPFEEFLLSIHQLPLEEQEPLIREKFNRWKGTLEQVDDVCVIGVKISWS